MQKTVYLKLKKFRNESMDGERPIEQSVTFVITQNGREELISNVYTGSTVFNSSQIGWYFPVSLWGFVNANTPFTGEKISCHSYENIFDDDGFLLIHGVPVKLDLFKMNEEDKNKKYVNLVILQMNNLTDEDKKKVCSISADVVFLDNDKGNNLPLSDVMIATNISFAPGWKSLAYSFPDYKTSLGISDSISSKEFCIGEGWASPESFDKIIKILKENENIIVLVSRDKEKVRIIEPQEVGFIDPEITKTEEFRRSFEEKQDERYSKYMTKYLKENGLSEDEIEKFLNQKGEN